MTKRIRQVSQRRSKSGFSSKISSTDLMMKTVVISWFVNIDGDMSTNKWLELLLRICEFILILSPLYRQSRKGFYVNGSVPNKYPVKQIILFFELQDDLPSFVSFHSFTTIAQHSQHSSNVTRDNLVTCVSIQTHSICKRLHKCHGFDEKFTLQFRCHVFART